MLVRKENKIIRRGRKYEAAADLSMGISDAYITARNPKNVYIVKERDSYYVEAREVPLELHHNNEDCGEYDADLYLKIDLKSLDEDEKEQIVEWEEERDRLEWTDGVSFKADIEKKGMGYFNCDVYYRPYSLDESLLINDFYGHTIEVVIDRSDVWFKPKDSNFERYIDYYHNPEDYDDELEL